MIIVIAIDRILHCFTAHIVSFSLAINIVQQIIHFASLRKIYTYSNPFVHLYYYA